ncbi:FMN-binding protein [Streptomyces niveus]|uniref:FMN-binding protein n=1 Tax=Streptomyces niveus TaxID=193462 RepID=UPI0003C60D19|nr:hypothetical protein [Streptomyces niveus]EST23030.1 hypothetical protein M877_28335 [Streptomyces niveus NCIMB 11891]
MTHLNKKIATAAMLGLSAGVVLVGCSSPNGTDTPPSASASRLAAPTATASGSGYADGTYSADGEYGTQDSSIGVTVTLDQGVITQVEVAPHATNETSRDFQDRFAQAAPEAVEGRPIDDVQLDRLAGSSGTPDGFNDALAKIKAEASR